MPRRKFCIDIVSLIRTASDIYEATGELCSCSLQKTIFTDPLLTAIHDVTMKCESHNRVEHARWLEQGQIHSRTSNTTQSDFHLLFSLCLDTPLVEHSTYSSALGRSSETYFRERCRTPKHYYQALEINIAVSGQYDLWSNSRMKTYGCLYQDTFNLVDPSLNQIASNADGCNNGQFRLQSFLQKSTTYILVVTSFAEGATGPFSILIIGGANVSFIRQG